MKLQNIFGFHAVQSRVRMKAESVKEVYVDATRHDQRMKNFLAIIEKGGVRVLKVDAKRLDGLAAGGRHQGVVALAEPVQLAQFVEDVLDEMPADLPPFLLVLDGVTDPHNLGACLRSADAAGVHAVIAPKDKSVGLTAIVAKVASGAAETVPYIMVTNLARTLRDLKDRGIWLVGLDEDGEKPVYQSRLTGPVGLVMGAEGDGMRRLTRETCDELVRIPMYGHVESLNVSVAAGVCLFEAVRQREAALAAIAKVAP